MADKFPLKQTVSKIRETVIKDFAKVLEKLGFDINGDITTEKRLSAGEEKQKNKVLSVLQNMETKGKSGFIEYIEDSSRTFLHILLAFKTMEKRGLMAKLLSKILEQDIRDNKVILDFKTSDPSAFTDICKRYSTEIEKLEKEFNSQEDEDYYKFVYVINLLSAEMGEEVPLLFKDLEHSLIKPDFQSVKEILGSLEEIPLEEYLKDDFLGWVYQYWVDVKDKEIKDAEKEKKTGYKENVYFEILKELEEEQTQFGEFYTPKWVVKYIVDNTLKPYWEENKKIEEIKLLDPACGAGNFLVYAFDVFYDLWKEEHPELSEMQIISNIVTKNIFGVDIHRQPLQITALNIWLKANKKAIDVNIKNMNLFRMNVLKANSLYRYENDPTVQLTLWETVQKEFDNAYKAEDIGQYISTSGRMDMIKAKQFFSQKFEVIVMNPPFVDARKMDSEMSDFLKKEYPENSRNLFSAFIERVIEISKKSGMIGFVSPDTWLTINSYISVRERILSLQILEVCRIGDKVFEGPTVSSLIAIMKNFKSLKNHIFKYIKKNYLYEIEQIGISEMEEKRFIIDGSKNLRKLFYGKKLKDFSEIEIRKGVVTANDNKYLKYKWEVPNILINISFLKYYKDNDYYLTDNHYVLDWRNETQSEIIKSSSARCAYILNDANLIGDKYSFRKGVTYNLIGEMRANYLSEDYVFNVTSPSVLCDKKDILMFILGMLNSKVVKYFLKLLNNTISITPGDIRNIPIKSINNSSVEKYAEQIIVSKEKINSFKYLSYKYNKTELDYGFNNLCSRIELAFLNYAKCFERLELDIYQNENLINEEIFNIYEITPDDRAVIEEEFGTNAYLYEKVSDAEAETLLSKEELSQLYCIGKPTITVDEETEEGREYKEVTEDGKRQKPMTIIEIAEYKKMNPDNVLYLREKYGIYREKDLKEAVLNWLRAIVKDNITGTNKLYLDEDIEKLIKHKIEEKYPNGHELIDEAEQILEKTILEVIRAGVKITSSSKTLAGEGSKDLDEPLLQQRVIAGKGKDKVVVLWHLQDFLLEFEEDKKYTMQNEIRRIKDFLEQRLLRVKDKLNMADKKEKKGLEKAEKLLTDAVGYIEAWNVVGG